MIPAGVALLIAGAAPASAEELEGEAIPPVLEFPGPSKADTRPAPASGPSRTATSAATVTPAAPVARPVGATATGGNSGATLGGAPPEAAAAFGGLVSTLLPVTKNSGDMSFKVNGCTRWTDQDLIDFFLKKKSMQKSFTFKDGCDLQGSLTAGADQIIHGDFKVRNLRDVESAILTVKVEKAFHFDTQEVEVGIVAQEGILTSPRGEQTKFRGSYTLVYHILKKQLDNSEGGEIEITEYKGKKVSLKQRIILDKHVDVVKF